jgi:hypothetical protein
MVVHVKMFFDEALTLVTLPDPESVESRTAKPPTGEGPVLAEARLIEKGAKDASWVYARVPKSASVEFPGYRQAGKFSMTLDFSDLPIDPRTVRAAAVEIHFGTVSDDDFRDGMVATSGPRASILKTRTVGGTPNSETLRMVAMVDEWDVVHDDSGSTVEMSGRDLRGVLLDIPIDIAPGADQTLYDQLDLSLPINEVVRDILRFNPLFDLITVTVNPAEWPDGVVPAPGDEDVIPRHRKGAKGQRKGGRANAPSGGGAGGGGGGVNFWDLIVKLCYLVGAIPYFKGTDLIIRPSATIFDKIRGPVDPVRNPTPFAGGVERQTDAVSGAGLTPPLKIRRMVYGRDVQSFNFNRKYSGFRRPAQIRCISRDPDGGGRGKAQIVQGFWPLEPTVTKVNAQGTQAQEEIVNIPVRDVKDPKRLEEIARAVYEEIARGELGGSLETKNLSSFGGSNADPDLLALGPGDGIEMLVDTRSINSGAPLVSTLTNHERASFAERVADITQRLGDENLARVIVATARGQVAELQRFFRVQNVKFSWDAASGMKIGFDFQNYVVARNQIETASGAPGAAQKVATPRG